MFKEYFSYTYIVLILGTTGYVHVARPLLAQYFCVTVAGELAQCMVRVFLEAIPTSGRLIIQLNCIQKWLWTTQKYPPTPKLNIFLFDFLLARFPEWLLGLQHLLRGGKSGKRDWFQLNKVKTSYLCKSDRNVWPHVVKAPPRILGGYM